MYGVPAHGARPRARPCAQADRSPELLEGLVESAGAVENGAERVQPLAVGSDAGGHLGEVNDSRVV